MPLDSSLRTGRSETVTQLDLEFPDNHWISGLSKDLKSCVIQSNVWRPNPRHGFNPAIALVGVGDGQAGVSWSRTAAGGDISECQPLTKIDTLRNKLQYLENFELCH